MTRCFTTLALLALSASLMALEGFRLPNPGLLGKPLGDRAVALLEGEAGLLPSDIELVQNKGVVTKMVAFYQFTALADRDAFFASLLAHYHVKDHEPGNGVANLDLQEIKVLGFITGGKSTYGEKEERVLYDLQITLCRYGYSDAFDARAPSPSK